MKSYKISENTLNKAVKSVITEFLNRDDMQMFSNLGIKDPTENSVVNEQELKQKCSEFIQKSNEYIQYLNQFYAYIDGTEEDLENGIEKVNGVRDVIRSRNLFGARNLHDEYLESDLDTLSKSIRELRYAINDTIECAESF